MLYDAEGNYIGGVDDDEAGDSPAKKKKKPAKTKAKKKKESTSSAALDDSAAAAEGPSPFAQLDDPLLGAREETDAVLEVEEGGELEKAGPPKTEAEKRQADELQKKKDEYYKQLSTMNAAMGEQQKQKKKERGKTAGNPMGHFSHEAADDKGLISDGIYFWTNMGLGKMPLKIKKQWQGTSDANPKKARKNFRLVDH
ncbi:hypothetical protein DIPPA_15411 [Diplonema papillatum]|nr:hypothetical protein DIPPA_15411 [Diplonema papillatum]|eukprot:gene15715-24001_t